MVAPQVVRAVSVGSPPHVVVRVGEWLVMGAPRVAVSVGSPPHLVVAVSVGSPPHLVVWVGGWLVVVAPRVGRAVPRCPIGWVPRQQVRGVDLYLSRVGRHPYLFVLGLCVDK